MKRTVLLSTLVSLLAVGSAIAHHAYSENDRSQLVALEGTLMRVQWANPHVLLMLLPPTFLSALLRYRF